MRRFALLFAVLFVLPVLGSDSPKEYDDKMEYVGIEGTWRQIEIDYHGKTSNPTSEVSLTVRSGTFVFNLSDGNGLQGNFRIDPTRKPPHLDYMPNGSLTGQTLMHIYQIDSNTLRIAYLDIAFRPQEFTQVDIVETYKRVK